ncbi:MAG: SPOR domain-containing protein [Rhizobacter sp.]|nr:SPOR domain-containing protein [Rhizobacter sp.]
MLRLLVVVLVLANITFYAWTQGMLDNVVGVRAQGDREPDRLNRQVHPEIIRVMPPPTTGGTAMGTAAPAAAPDAPATVCLQAGPYTPAQIGAAEGVLQTVLPPGSWVSLKAEGPAVWIVYMGKYTNREALQKKADELKRLKIAYEELRNVSPELDMGLALGRYDTRAAADKALAEVTQRGVRTAKVMTLTPPTVTHSLRVERADATLQARLTGLRAEALQGKSFTPCPRP